LPERLTRYSPFKIYPPTGQERTLSSTPDISKIQPLCPARIKTGAVIFMEKLCPKKPTATGDKVAVGFGERLYTKDKTDYNPGILETFA
jgi:hypothetical protein